MNDELLRELQTTQQEMEPKVKAMSSASSALKQAIRLASQEKADALPMQKALAKLEQSLALVDAQGLHANGLQSATQAFAAETSRALDALAYEFARDLKETFEARGERVEGRPPTLVVEPLVLQIDINARKAQWFYGKEALTRPLALSLGAIVSAYDQQRKQIVGRRIATDAFLRELHAAWIGLLQEKSRRRINIVEAYSKLVLNRQSARFWNAPSRSTFKDYERPFFVRDLVLARDADPTVEVDGQRLGLRLGVATKSQTESTTRSIWIPTSALDGDYYSEVTFEEV
ncbi:MAG: hypothetical protein KF893_00210 [Caldilineaceae bacterium]|nr:hypothetical protein [Caldilineaceae bacterium]